MDADYTIITVTLSVYGDIKKKIAEGWIPVGAPIMSQTSSNISQAMYKPPSASSLTQAQGGSGRSRRTRRRSPAQGGQRPTKGKGR
jgi:hypothetical protein